MKTNIVWASLRGIVLFGVVGCVLLIVKTNIVDKGTVSANVFMLIIGITLGGSAAVVMKDLLHALEKGKNKPPRNGREPPIDRVVSPELKLKPREATDPREVYRYPRGVPFGALVLTLAFALLPLYGWASMSTSVRSVLGLVAICLFLVAIHCVIFSITLGSDAVILRSFITREILYERITQIEISRSRSGLSALISVKGGRKYSLSGNVSDFAKMVESLNERAGLVQQRHAH